MPTTKHMPSNGARSGAAPSWAANLLLCLFVSREKLIAVKRPSGRHLPKIIMQNARHDVNVDYGEFRAFSPSSVGRTLLQLMAHLHHVFGCQATADNRNRMTRSDGP